MSSRTYGGLIWTNHALDRLKERGLSQENAWLAFKGPDFVEERDDNAKKFLKKIGAYHVSILAKKNEKNEWIVISAWMDPPLPGTPDAKKKEDYHRFRKASVLGKLFLTLKKQLGF